MPAQGDICRVLGRSRSCEHQYVIELSGDMLCRPCSLGCADLGHEVIQPGWVLRLQVGNRFMGGLPCTRLSSFIEFTLPLLIQFKSQSQLPEPPLILK